MTHAVRALWEEPAVADPPGRVWRDWLLLAVIVVAAIVEVLVRPDVTWRPAALGLCLLLAVATLWRRAQPLAVVIVATPCPLILAVPVAIVAVMVFAAGLWWRHILYAALALVPFIVLAAVVAGLWLQHCCKSPGEPTDNSDAAPASTEVHGNTEDGDARARHETRSRA